MWSTQDIPDQQGRTAVVTGANGGLGLEVARALARSGAAIVIAARNRGKAERARAAISSEVPGASVELRDLDLACLASVRACAQGLLADHDRLDVLVNNAGVMGIPERTTVDGFEMQLAANHLGHFVLTHRLLPALIAAPAARIVSVTSFARFAGRPVDPDNPHLRGRYDPWRAYGQAKLATLLFAVELQRRLADSAADVASLAAHPGLAYTGLQAHSVEATGGGRSQRFWHALARRVGMPPQRAALPLLRAATDPGAQGGELYGPRWLLAGPPVRRPIMPRPQWTARSLWAVSEIATGERFDVTAAVTDRGG